MGYSDTISTLSDSASIGYDSAQQHEKDLITALANRSYHLPEHTYWQDFRQYFGNNHPLFGICLHDKFHPIKIKIRLVALLGSIFFGITVSNMFFFLELMDDRFQKFCFRQELPTEMNGP